ncbi:SusC/RagA family TonB-linked outer membrane protein [Sinomicrobium soli]|nr:SusC/RagA family TonB-linked outer membrane protein [Sinomicrobium sp. N-1-3-6]
MIIDQTQYRFIYPENLFRDIPRVQLKKGRIRVDKLLAQSISTAEFSITLTADHTIIIKPRQEAYPSLKNIQQREQQRLISGTVTDSNGEPLGGVNIVVSGKGQGTISGFDGSYSLTAIPQDTLVYSFVGFKTRKESVGERLTLNVVLQEDVMALGEVTVNAGYYTVKDRERTGSISRVTSEEIELQPLANPVQSLQGRMAGVEINQFSGVPGSYTGIQIRGRNSLGRDSFPLYIIDGVPVSSDPISTRGLMPADQGIDPLQTINLNNIESIEVLKDADATSIYGSRGANGVVLITTKKGKGAEETIYDFNLYTGVGKVSNTMDLLNTGQYLEMRREAFANDGITEYPAIAYDINGTWDQNRYTNWQKEFIGGSANITHINGSVSGGSARTSFLLGGSYHQETTVFPGNFGYHKLTGNLNLNHRSNDDRFQAVLSLNYGVDHNRLFADLNLVGQAIWLPPNAPRIYNDRGELNWENETWSNPFAGQQKEQEIKTDNFIVNSSLEYSFFSDLSLKVNLGYTDLNVEETVKIPKSSYRPRDQSRVSHSSQHGNTKRKSWIVEPQLFYATTLGHAKLDVLVGTTFQKNEYVALSLNGEGYANESLIGNLGAAANVSAKQNNSEYAYTAIFGRIGFNWNKKYFINLTGRRDGSSRFGPGNRFGNFGAVGTAWIFSEETLFRKVLPFINFGKLRGSYGTTGNDQIPDYGYYAIYQPTNGPGGLYPTQLANPDYGWEVNKKLETALDIGFLEDRIRTGIGWYYNRSSNQLVGYPLPDVTGFSSVQANMPATVRNTGWELEVHTLNIKSANLSWNTSFNITWPKNTLVKYDDLEQSSYANRYRVGQPLNIVLAYEYTGIDPETGLYQVRDVNEDGRYNYDDRIMTIPLGRKYYGGLNNTLQFKNFQLDFLLEFVRQKGVANRFVHNYASGRGPNNSGNIAEELWNNPNTQNFTTLLSNNTLYGYAKSSDIGYNSDASFIRLKNISLSYTLPKAFISKIGMKSCKLYLHAQNLITWTNFIGLDPQYATRGTDVLPALKMITGGVQLKF